jgi:hypothetical protein
MANSNDYKLKDCLRQKIAEAIEEMTADDNYFGWIPDDVEVTMTEAAWLILEQNRQLNNWLKDQGYLKDPI